MPIPKCIMEKIQEHDIAITAIDLSNRGLNDNDISELHELLQSNRYINTINLADNNFTEAGCKLLRLIPGLQKLNVSGCYVGDNGITYLIGTKIESLDVSNCGITKDGADLLLASVKQFKELNVDKNPRIPGDILYKIRQNFVPGLTEAATNSLPVIIDLGLNIHSSYATFATTPVHLVSEIDNSPSEICKLK